MDQNPKQSPAPIDIAATARGHAGPALAELDRIAREGQSEATRIAAIKEILALALGKGGKTGTDAEDIEVETDDDWAKAPPSSPS